MSPGPRELFAGVFARGDAAEALSDAAWVQALLDFEVALARALARAGVVPEAAAEAVVAAAVPSHVSFTSLAEGTSATGSPIPALVKELEKSLPLAAASALHHAATSQDVVDTAMVLVCKRALGHVLDDLRAAADASAALARKHRLTVMLGRTLLQQAVPITFGLKAAGWLWSLDDAHLRLAAVCERLPVQYGGAVGTLAPLGERGVEVVKLLAAELGLREPTLPWHTHRAPILELASACGIAAAALGKVARDVSLLTQGEVDEVREPAAAGRGASSAMPHKQNPVGSIAALGCTRRMPGLLSTLFAGAEQEHERAAGGWHAEWETVTDLVRLLGSAASWMREVVSGLTVNVERMRANFDAAGGLPLAERVSAELTPRLGRNAAEALVRTAVERARGQGLHLREVLATDAELVQSLRDAGVGAEQLTQAFDPGEYLGSSAQFIDRALAAHAAHAAHVTGAKP
jgi:3-carboxy-cis,cis-muconate cycloisomerase